MTNAERDEQGGSDGDIGTPRPTRSGRWDAHAFERSAHLTVRRLARHVERSEAGETPVLRRRPPGEIARLLDIRRYLREGGMTAESYKRFLDRYLDEGVRMHHPAYLAHQVASPDFPAALGDLIHGVTNNVMSIYEMGAAAATVEFEVLRWMLDKVGFTRGAGVLTHGGSLANLTALLAARSSVAPNAWTDAVGGTFVLWASPATHYSLTRAMGIIGLGADNVRPLPVDEWGRIDSTRLPEILDHPQPAIALVANACTTGSGLYDDLVTVGRFCRENGIWFHVDGAHGASALLSDRYRHLLDGIELADSVVWDAHKMLRTSGVAAAVLVRDEAALDAAFRQQASYLFYGDQGFDQLRRTVEGTKAALGLKIFLNLAWRGERGLGDYVAQCYETAHLFWHIARRRAGFELPYEPQSNIVCFRYGTGDHARLRQVLMDEGSYHLSSTELAGRRYLRLTVMAPATCRTTLESLLDRIVALDQRVTDSADER
ncbi:pyridoxal phosphate-dependent decarboxylase family protein [Pseudonocardia spinosispora]|uniref:pyridoxal phosphate-dependent decarboxylase family protein n=1 Tax=Pseudonocardia spinosispora TaxID=103441 RepID=UPI00041E8128|nr:aminotransferase class V-fold PLP-dependent enzyme [Pseudonocardia spinosispora]